MLARLARSEPLSLEPCRHSTRKKPGVSHTLRPHLTPRYTLRKYATTKQPQLSPPSSKLANTPPPSLYHLYRLSLLSFALVSFTVYTIRSTTADIFGVQGLSMFPLLRPSISQAEAFLLTDSLSSTKTPRSKASKERSRDAIFAQDRDRIIIVPPAERQWPVLSSPLLRVRAAVYWLLGAHNLDFRLGDSPLEEGGDGRRSNLERGMVVVFFTPYERERQAVKRIVALEGDVVVPVGVGGNGRRRKIQWDEQSGMDDLCSGRWVEFSTVDEEGGKQRKGGVRVPYGHVWLEGVNQAASVDSNELGPISKSLIIGVATGVVYPFSRTMPWRESWRDDCAGRVFRRDGRGRWRAVGRVDELDCCGEEGAEADDDDDDDVMAGEGGLVRVPEKWAL